MSKRESTEEHKCVRGGNNEGKNERGRERERDCAGESEWAIGGGEVGNWRTDGRNGGKIVDGNMGAKLDREERNSGAKS